MKKNFPILILAILLTIMVSGVAIAAEGGAEIPKYASIRGGRLNFGEISELGTDDFTITTRGGGSFIYLVDEYTHYRMKDIDDPSFGSLEIGQFVIVAAHRVDGDLCARMVGITPEGFNPAPWFGVQARGEVQEIDLDDGTVTLLTSTGRLIEYKVVGRTRFIGQVIGLDELEEGWVIGVLGGKAEDGTNIATIIVADENPRRVRYVGLVTSLDGKTSTVSILTRKGDKIFSIDNETKFHGRDGEIEGLDDLQLDMVVIIQSLIQKDGTNIVKHLAAVEKEDLPNFEVKKGGKVISVDSDTFTIETSDGKEVKFSIDNDTKFRSRGIAIKSLEDLKIGLIALVGGEELADGTFLARLVIAIQKPRD